MDRIGISTHNTDYVYSTAPVKVREVLTIKNY